MEVDWEGVFLYPGRQVASALPRLKLINSRIKGGSRNGLPLTALWQYDVFFQQSFCSCWTSPPPLHRLPSSSSLVLSDLRCKVRTTCMSK
jgi:hypothetical protein